MAENKWDFPGVEELNHHANVRLELLGDRYKWSEITITPIHGRK